MDSLEKVIDAPPGRCKECARCDETHKDVEPVLGPLVYLENLELAIKTRNIIAGSQEVGEDLGSVGEMQPPRRVRPAVGRANDDVGLPLEAGLVREVLLPPSADVAIPLKATHRGIDLGCVADHGAQGRGSVSERMVGGRVRQPTAHERWPAARDENGNRQAYSIGRLHIRDRRRRSTH